MIEKIDERQGGLILSKLNWYLILSKILNKGFIGVSMIDKGQRVGTEPNIKVRKKCVQWKGRLEKIQLSTRIQCGNTSFLTWNLGRKNQMNKQKPLL